MKRRDLLSLAAGAAALAPLAAAAAHQSKVTIGVLSVFAPAASASRIAAFQQAVAETGYVEGRNLEIEYRWAEHRYDRLPLLAADLVERRVDLIAAFGPPAAHAAKKATSTIPIVFGIGTDPIKEGLVASYARPGGNLTGITLLIGDLTPKRLALISDLIPHAKTIGLLTNPTNPELEEVTAKLRDRSRRLNLELITQAASTSAELDAAFAALGHEHVDVLLVDIDTFFVTRSEEVVALAARYAIPAIYAFREFTTVGGLISYGIDILAVYRQMGTYVGRILARRTTPADLPVEQPTKFELVLNMKTAKSLGLTVPQSLLARADEVIE